MDYTVHGILQARIPEWVAFPFSGDLPNPGIEPRAPKKPGANLAPGLSFLICGMKVNVSQSCPTLCDPHGLYSPRNSPGQNTGVGSLSLLQEIFPT